ncbi:Vacuolar protein 8 [Linum perenne]
MKRMFTIIPAAAFRKLSVQLENSIGDVSWLLRVSTSGDANEPILCLIWEQIAILYTGSSEERSDAAASLVSLARDNDRYGRLIIEEGGVPPLLKLAKEGKMEGQENAARAIGLLGRDPDSVEAIVNAGACNVFAKMLKEGHMKVQAVVAWAVSELAAKALWQLAKGNLTICRSITESRALLCFAILLEKGEEEVQSYSAMALMEITNVAEQHADLRRSAFKPTSPSARAVLDQLLKVISAAESDLLVPCIRALGSLARTFRATETRVVGPLVKLLDEKEPEVMMEAAVALNKFASNENFLCVNHSKAVIAGGGTKHLIQLVYFGEQVIQVPSLILLCYITMNCPDSEILANEEVLIVLEWSTKQSHLVENQTIQELLPEAKSRLELYQSRGSRGFH